MTGKVRIELNGSGDDCDKKCAFHSFWSHPHAKCSFSKGHVGPCACGNHYCLDLRIAALKKSGIVLRNASKKGRKSKRR